MLKNQDKITLRNDFRLNTINFGKLSKRNVHFVGIGRGSIFLLGFFAISAGLFGYFYATHKIKTTYLYLAISATNSEGSLFIMFLYGKYLRNQKIKYLFELKTYYRKLPFLKYWTFYLNNENIIINKITTQPEINFNKFLNVKLIKLPLYKYR